MKSLTRAVRSAARKTGRTARKTVVKISRSPGARRAKGKVRTAGKALREAAAATVDLVKVAVERGQEGARTAARSVMGTPGDTPPPTTP